MKRICPLLLSLAALLPAADSVDEAQRLLAEGKRAEARQILDERTRENPNDERARQLLLSVRINELEAQIRSMVAENAASKGDLAAAPDIEEAKAQASADVRRRLEFVEYFLVRQDYARAVEACKAILRDHPHDPATSKILYRILTTMLEREKTALEHEREVSVDASLNDGYRKSVIPREKPKMARTVWVFDEDVQEVDRQAVRAQMQEKVTMDYDAVGVGEVLKPLFALAGLNYVILDEAIPAKTLTLHVVDETVENVLATVAKLVKVRYQYQSRTVFIASEDTEVLVSEIIRLESGLTDVDKPAETGSALGAVLSGGSGGASGAPSAPPRQTSQSGQQGQAGSDLERFIEKIPDLVVGWPKEGKMYLDRKSNTLYLRSTPAAIGEVKRLLRALDYNNVQVLIETQFVEVSEKAGKSLGVDWSGNVGSRNLLVGDSAFSGALLSGVPSFRPLSSPIDPAGIGSGGFNLGVLFAPSGTLGIKAAISALETESQAQRLAEPRILCLNNKEGLITIQRTENYIESFEYETVTSSVVSNNGTTTPVQTSNPKPVWGQAQFGYFLKIKPSVARNSDVITMELNPQVTESIPDLEKGARNVFAISDPNNTARTLNGSKPNYVTRSISTALHVKNGETVVLGGLTDETHTKSDSGVPGVRKVPILGGLFGKNDKSQDRKNLMIFVTAHIIDPSGAKLSDEIRRLRDTATALVPTKDVIKDKAEPAAKPTETATPPTTAPNYPPLKKGR